MNLVVKAGGAQVLWAGPGADDSLDLAWLGQAGFALRHGGHRLLVDPYLSDHLARKYAGTEFPHDRMMPPPVVPDRLPGLDFVLCSHRHGDHMDPGSLAVLAAGSPSCRFVIPRAEKSHALGLGLAETRLLPINAGESVRADGGLEICAIPSAHEKLEVNAAGEHHFLGFVLRLGRITVYHSGDCVSYPGLAEELRKWRIDLALLPVNGRRTQLAARGIAGNMTFAEACGLCRAARIGCLVPHHFGMFAFNTVDPDHLRRQFKEPVADGLQCHLPDVHHHYTLV